MEREKHEWKKIIKHPVFLLICVAITCFLIGFFSRGKRSSEPEITETLLANRLEDISELAATNYHYTNMGKFEDQADFYGWKVPLTKKSFIISYDGLIKAGIDLKELQLKISRKKIIITLPKSKILSHEIKEDSIEIYDETKNIFNPIQIEDYTSFSADQKGKMEQKAAENGLLTEAEEKVKSTITNLLNLSDELKNHYQIEFKEKKD